MPASPTSTRPSIDLYLDDVHVAVKRRAQSGYREEDGQRVMKQSEITVRVGAGPRQRRRHGLDLRLQPRLREHQRRLPFMNVRRCHEREIRSILIERAEQLHRPHRSDPAAAAVGAADWNAVDRLALPQARVGPRRAGAGAPRGRDVARRPEGNRRPEGEDPAQHAAVRRRASRPTTCC